MEALSAINEVRPRPKLRSYFWSDEEPLKNLGDALAPWILRGMGYTYSRYSVTDRDVANPGRCIFAIGSMLEDPYFDLVPQAIDIWGCGWQGGPLSASNLARATIHAVRGPYTAELLGLPRATPMGDPALLLPRMLQMSPAKHGQTVVIPHFTTVFGKTRQDWLDATGCDEVVSTQVLGKIREWATWGLPLAQRVLQLWHTTHIQIRDALQTVRLIAGASFVLSASLHGAILAQAYGVPWALFDDGYVTSKPSKYVDWVRFLNIDLEFFDTLAQGRKWWHQNGSKAITPNLDPLIRSFPYGTGNAVEWTTGRHSDE